MTDRSTQLDGPEDSDDDTFDQIKYLWISVISTCVLILIAKQMLVWFQTFLWLDAFE